MFKRYYRSSIVLALLGFYNAAQSFFPLNLFVPWDINLRPPIWCDRRVQITGYLEHALKVQAFDGRHHRVSDMELWNPTVLINNVPGGGQNALAMLAGYPEGSPETTFLMDPSQLDNPTDNGIRGHFKVTGDVKIPYNAGLATRFHLPYGFTLGFFCPWYSMSVENVAFHDLTQETTEEDLRVRELLTSQLSQRVAEFDPTLNLNGWKRSGFGDFVILCEWMGDYPQQKPILKNVNINPRLGIIVPTGKRKNENDILSIPFGFDGATGLIFGGGINLNWLYHFKGGIDVEFINLFGSTRERRIKVDRLQTDFLLLQKAKTYIDYGFTQRFNLYLQAERWWQGLSSKITYQYWKHNEDKLFVLDNSFSSDIASTAASLQEWTIHEFIFILDYDFQVNLSNDTLLAPQLSFFAKVPFNGKRSLLATTVGGTFTLNF